MMRRGLGELEGAEGIRVREERTKPKKAWEETREDFSARMKAIARDINETCDVAGSEGYNGGGGS